MTSLYFTNEHLAWQQRVYKEVSTSNASAKHPSRSPVVPISLRKFKKIRRKLMSESRAPKTHEAKPSALPRLVKALNAPSEQVVSRPATQGSLVKARFGKNKPSSHKPVSEVDPVEEVVETRPLPQEAVRTTAKPRPAKAVPVAIQEEPVEEAPHQEEEELEAKETEEADEVHPLPSAAPSEISFRTTSSQKRYIVELESRLQEETEKRLELEAKFEALRAELLGKASS